ncbi:guanylyl cyclase 1 isoform X2 [Andrographis paniculata]|uniref:guanylyl cyclase 1 isoform X2 n=1 Tax=Andrographis paniculata TaxID=175694 RepID=UPI0021E93CC5|nr:guanylyl cyclase 1 isoform X2 [Andrographis paniculata]
MSATFSNKNTAAKSKLLMRTCCVPHINQECMWDCGLACVLMVLRSLNVYSCSLLELGEICRTTSIWTVDLAYLLQKFSVSFTYCTVTLGANPDFSVETFYKDQLSNDLVRVNMLFQEARHAGIHIECRSVGTKELSTIILSGKYVAIALVDQYKLSHCGADDYDSDMYSSSSYTGHYIVICGYDGATDEFEIRDPASSRKRERVSCRCLEWAHKSFGTDEDLLLISVEKGDGQDGALGLFS